MGDMRFSSNMKPQDFLSYVLIGDWNGHDYDLNPDQVDRMQEVIEKVLVSRMAAITEIPPVSPEDIKIDRGIPKDDLPN